MEKNKGIMDKIRTLLNEGLTKKEIIAKGYSKSTVYAIAKKNRPRIDLNAPLSTFFPGEVEDENLGPEITKYLKTKTVGEALIDCIDMMLGYDAFRRISCSKKTSKCSSEALDCILCDEYKKTLYQ